MNRVFILTILLSVVLFGCKNLVEKFDDRLAVKYLKKGFIAKTIETKKSTIHYFDNQLEDKPIIIFVHGFGGDGKISWWDQAKYFSDEYRVIVPDIYWFGKSYSDDTPSLEEQIQLVKQIVKTENLSSVNLVGISYGGFISLGYAQEYPSDLKTLSIVDSPGAAMSQKEIVEFCQRVGAESVQDAFIPESEEEVERLMNFAFYDPPKLTSGIREGTIGIYFSKHPEKQAVLLEELPSNRSRVDGVVDVPVLILWGEEDQVFLVREAKELQKQLDAELEIIPGAGHALPEEKPKEFNKYLELFVEKYQD